MERDDEMIPEVSGTTSYQPWSLNRVGLYTPGGIEEKSIFIPQVSFVDKENDHTIVSQSGAYLAPNRPVMLSSPSSAATSKLVSLLPPPRTLSSQSFGASSKFVVLSHPTTLGSQIFSASSSETVMNTDEGVNRSVKGSSQVNDSPVKLNSCYTASDIANPMIGNPNEKVFFFMHKCGCNITMNISDGYATPIGFRSKCGSVENCEWFRSQGKMIDDKNLPTVTYKPGLAASGNETVMNTDKSGDTSVTASSPADSSMVKVNSRYNITINPMKANPDEQNGLLRHKCGCIAVMNFSTGYAMPIGFRSQCSRPNRSCDWFRSRGMYKNVLSMYKPAVDNSATPKVFHHMRCVMT